MTLREGTLLHGGRYRITHFISSGGFGCTYEGEHTMLGKRVAIKEFFVHSICSRDGDTGQVSIGAESQRELIDKLRKKFIDEARALGKMKHPCIVDVQDVFEDNGTAYFVMDYIDGRSVDDIIKKQGPLSEEKALEYIDRLCDALEYVHKRKRLHLDVKPANIMVDRDGDVVLIDFGASKQYDEANGENTSSLIGRTPGFAPAEQMGNDVGKFTPATDIYAVGATLYKMLTGTTPIPANQLAAGEELDPLPAHISENTKRAVEAAMQLRKKDRPKSIAEFRAILHNLIKAEPKKPKRFLKSTIIAFCIAALITALAIISFKIGQHSTPTVVTQPAAQAEQVTEEVEDLYTAMANTSKDFDPVAHFTRLLHKDVKDKFPQYDLTEFRQRLNNEDFRREAYNALVSRLGRKPKMDFNEFSLECGVRVRPTFQNTGNPVEDIRGFLTNKATATYSEGSGTYRVPLQYEAAFRQRHPEAVRRDGGADAGAIDGVVSLLTGGPVRRQATPARPAQEQ